MCRLEDRGAGHIVDVRARRDADTADLCCKRIGEIISVQVESGDHIELVGAGKNLLQSDVGDRILDQDPSCRQRALLLGVGRFFTVFSHCAQV